MDTTYKSASVFKQSTKGALFHEVGVIPFQGLLNILKNCSSRINKSVLSDEDNAKKIANYIYYSR